MILHNFIVLSLLTYVKCSRHQLIVGGTRAKITDFPHAMALYVICNNRLTYRQSMYVCGASVLSEWIALTAAHCIAGCIFTESVYSVTAGTDTLRRGLHSTIKALYYHKKYDDVGMAYDIGLLRLRTKMPFSSVIKRVVILPNAPYREEAQVVGWGAIQDVPNIIIMTKYLFFIDQYVVRNHICDICLETIKEGAFCAESKTKTKYAASGDSGSALVLRGYIQIGIVSFKMLHLSNSLVVYTNTSSFSKWIKKHAEKLHCL
uniref:SFRICE_011515 n=1 Tax=Spodoptera frugiperda TaxID=7108 RepID=A0A2H1W4Q5_SPOFR